MIEGRILASATRGFGGLSRNILANQKPWGHSLSSSTRAISYLRTRLGPAAPQKPSPFADVSLIKKRFFQSENHNKSSSFWSTWSSKLFAAFGVLFGVGTGAAYHAMSDKDSIFGKYYLVACQGPRDNCGCKPKEPECIEKKCEESPCLRARECEEELIVRANAELEKALKDTKGKAMEYTEAAMKAYCEAIGVMCDYLKSAYCVIDNDDLEPPEYEEAWCCVYTVAKKRCEKVQDALVKGQCAWELLCRLREVIENGKNCKYTSCNPLLVTAEEALCCAEQELLKLKEKMDNVCADHDMVHLYRTQIENFRKDLKSDVNSQIKEMDCDIQFAEQEMALQIIQAYRRVMRTHKEVAMHLVCKGKLPDRYKETCC